MAARLAAQQRGQSAEQAVRAGADHADVQWSILLSPIGPHAKEQPLQAADKQNEHVLRRRRRRGVERHGYGYRPGKTPVAPHDAPKRPGHGQARADFVADPFRVYAGPAVVDAMDDRAGAEKHAARRGLPGTRLYPQDRTAQQAVLIAAVVGPAAKSRYRPGQAAAQANVARSHVGGAAGQQGDQRQPLKRSMLQQVGEHPGHGAVAAVDGQYPYGLIRQRGHGHGKIIQGGGRVMVNPGMICDNALNGLQLFAVAPAVGVADQAD